jgi:hypothetical protein
MVRAGRRYSRGLVPILAALIVVVTAAVLVVRARLSVPPPPAAANPGTSLSPVPDSDASGAGWILLPTDGSSGQLEVVDWSGHAEGSYQLPPGYGPLLVPEQSPDGSLLVINTLKGDVSTPTVVEVPGGHAIGHLPLGAQFIWADDDRHICEVSNPNPGPGETSLLSVSYAGETTRLLGSIGTGDATRDGIHTVAVCSTKHDWVGVLDERLTSSGAAIDGLGTTSIDFRLYSLSTFHLIRTIMFTASPVNVLVDPDGQYLVEESPQNTSDRIVNTVTGKVVDTFVGRYFLGFSGDDDEFVDGTQTASLADDTVEIRRVAGGALLHVEAGHLLWLAVQPSGHGFALGLALQQGQGDAPPPLRLVLIESSGATVLLRSVTNVSAPQ